MAGHFETWTADCGLCIKWGLDIKHRLESKDTVKNTRTNKKGATNCILKSAIHRLKQEQQITD